MTHTSIPAPYHRWRANEESRVRPFGLLDRCLDCTVARYDALVESPSVSPERRARAERTNAAAAGACPGASAEASA